MPPNAWADYWTRVCIAGQGYTRTGVLWLNGEGDFRRPHEASEGWLTRGGVRPCGATPVGVRCLAYRLLQSAARAQQ